jgi:hypothetical protein
VPIQNCHLLKISAKRFRSAIRAYENTRREGHEGLRIHCRAGPIKGKIPGTRHPGFLQPATWKAVDSCHRSGPLYFASESQAGESCHFYFRRFVFEQVQVIELAEPVKEYLPLPYFSDNVFDGNVPIPPAGVTKESWSQFMTRQLTFYGDWKKRRRKEEEYLNLCLPRVVRQEGMVSMIIADPVATIHSHHPSRWSTTQWVFSFSAEVCPK